MDPDQALDDGRRALAAWEDAESPGDEHDAARDMGEAFGALDDWLSNGGFLPERWRGAVATVRVRYGEDGPLIEGASVRIRQDEHGVAFAVTLPEGEAAHAIGGLSFRLPDSRTGHDAEAYAQASHIPWPGADAPVFDDDGRETDFTDPAVVPQFPLTGTCGTCGTPIALPSLHAPWQHGSA